MHVCELFGVCIVQYRNRNLLIQGSEARFAPLLVRVREENMIGSIMNEVFHPDL